MQPHPILSRYGIDPQDLLALDKVDLCVQAERRRARWALALAIVVGLASCLALAWWQSARYQVVPGHAGAAWVMDTRTGELRLFSLGDTRGTLVRPADGTP